MVFATNRKEVFIWNMNWGTIETDLSLLHLLHLLHCLSVFRKAIDFWGECDIIDAELKEEELQ